MPRFSTGGCFNLEVARNKVSSNRVFCTYASRSGVLERRGTCSQWSQTGASKERMIEEWMKWVGRTVPSLMRLLKRELCVLSYACGYSCLACHWLPSRFGSAIAFVVSNQNGYHCSADPWLALQTIGDWDLWHCVLCLFLAAAVQDWLSSGWTVGTHSFGIGMHRHWVAMTQLPALAMTRFALIAYGFRDGVFSKPSAAWLGQESTVNKNWQSLAFAGSPETWD